MKSEIERKFLIDHLPPDLETYLREDVKQGYLNFQPEMRIRRGNNTYWLTQKQEGNLVREENETAISNRQFDLLVPQVKGWVKKIRYRIPLGNGLTAEVDCYQENLEGLFTVEVEFPDLYSAQKFVIPSWFGPEITDDKRYKNKNLSQYSRDQVIDLLLESKGPSKRR